MRYTLFYYYNFSYILIKAQVSREKAQEFWNEFRFCTVLHNFELSIVFVFMKKKMRSLSFHILLLRYVTHILYLHQSSGTVVSKSWYCYCIKYDASTKIPLLSPKFFMILLLLHGVRYELWLSFFVVYAYSVWCMVYYLQCCIPCRHRDISNAASSLYEQDTLVYTIRLCITYGVLACICGMW
jgi:hypothetical protein